jgi:hypothetical protein
MTMDELRSTLFSAGLAAACATRRTRLAGPADSVADMMMWLFLWWIGFPGCLSRRSRSPGWIDQSTPFLLLSGATMVAAPLVMLLYDLQTLCVITNRRALILRTAWSKQTVTATAFADMDATFEILDIGRGAGHLNFASGVSTRSPDTDYTGRYGFRCIRGASAVRDILERARGRGHASV